MNSFYTNSGLVSIITINFNGSNDTLDLLESIYENIDSNYEVIIIDNASNLDDYNKLAVCCAGKDNVKLIRSDINLGFAGGNNLGLDYSAGNYIFFLNNDTIIKNNPIPELIKRLESSQFIGAVSPKIKFFWGNNPIQFAGYTNLSRITLRNSLIGFMQNDSPNFSYSALTPYIHGAAFMIKREIIKKVGKMPECYFLYYEELDWSERIKDVGYELWYEANAEVFHKESKSTGIDSPLKTYYIAKNRLLFAYRNNKSKFILSLFYLLLIAYPKQIFMNIINKRGYLNKSVIKGIKDFYKTNY